MIYFKYICGEIGGYLSACTSSISRSGVEEPGNEAMQQLTEEPLVSFPDYFSAEKYSLKKKLIIHNSYSRFLFTKRIMSTFLGL